MISGINHMVHVSLLFSSIDNVRQVFKFIYNILTGLLRRNGIEKFPCTFRLHFLHSTKFHFVERAFGLGDKEHMDSY